MFSAGVVLYTLLCGYEPFYGITDNELIAKNKKADIDFKGEEWECVSKEAKDLVLWCTNKDPYKRCTPKRALSHPFLKPA